MRCPVDNETLVMADRNGVEIDYCPKCRGVWLDRGELDKIIERVGAPAVAPAPSAAPQPTAPPQGYAQPHGYAAPPPPPQGYAPRGNGWDSDDRHYDDPRRHGYKKRKSILGEIFDF